MAVRPIYQEDKTSLNIYAPNNRTPKYTKQKQNYEKILKNPQLQLEFSMFPSIAEKTSRKSIKI